MIGRISEASSATFGAARKQDCQPSPNVAHKCKAPTSLPHVPQNQHVIILGIGRCLVASLSSFIYFENAPAVGLMNGVIKVTLEAQRIFPEIDGPPTTDRVVVVHLRMNIPAAESLRAELNDALLLASPSPTQTQN